MGESLCLLPVYECINISSRSTFWGLNLWATRRWHFTIKKHPAAGPNSNRETITATVQVSPQNREQSTAKINLQRVPCCVPRNVAGFSSVLRTGNEVNGAIHIAPQWVFSCVPSNQPKHCCCKHAFFQNELIYKLQTWVIQHTQQTQRLRFWSSTNIYPERDPHVRK